MNHFISVECSSTTGAPYLVIHCGSRSLGVKVANHYTELANKNMERHVALVLQEKRHALTDMKESGNIEDIQDVAQEYNTVASMYKSANHLAFIEDGDLEDYLNDMLLCNMWVKLNHSVIAREIAEHAGIDVILYVQSHHNYVDVDAGIIRKGAISAKRWEFGIIPLNMRDGSLMVAGKGNDDWNCSAPHGAGRVMCRKEAKNTISIEDYKSSMNGIYSTTVNYATIDEAPMAYKNATDIINAIEPTADVVDRLVPVYNFKDDTSSEEHR